MYPRGTPDGLVPGAPTPSEERPGWHVRLFGSHEFFRLWLVQVVSATGDWLGFSAIILLAAGIGGHEAGAGAGAISLVMAARIVPGFFFGPLAGVLVDRWDRKRVMIVCDLGRAAVIVCLPFVHNLIGLVIASLVLEVLTLLWSPAKEAIVPNLVAARPPDHRQLAVAGRGLRHVPLRVAALRAAGRGVGLAGVDRGARLPRSRPDGARLLRRRHHVRGVGPAGADAGDRPSAPSPRRPTPRPRPAGDSGRCSTSSSRAGTRSS